MWVVLHAEPGAELIYGFRPGVDREQFAAAIAADDTERCLQRVPVAKGDVIFVPAGAIHALGPGIIVAEIQQNSDTTYRIYDWGRPRALHIEKALDVLDFDLAAPAVVTPVALPGAPVPAEVTAECAYFRTERMHVASEVAIAGCCDGTTFEIWGVLEGSARVVWGDTALEVQEVGWVLLPAALGDFTVEAQPGTTLLRVITPEGS
jgi:mannose-6-phosphate isomerase